MASRGPRPPRQTGPSEGGFRGLEPVLVVGAGFIGSHICRRLCADGHPVRTLTRSRPEPVHARLLAGVDVVVAEAADPDAVEAAVADARWVVFGAGGLVPAASQSEPIHDVVLALKPLLTVLAAVGRRPGTAFTYLSSGGTVYGPSDRPLLREDDPTDPITAYGVLKLAGEKFTGMYARQGAIRYRILRCANVYGEGQRTSRGQGAVAAFLQAVADGTPIPLYGQGRVVRDFVHVDDVATAVGQLRPDERAGVDGSHVVNVGSGVGTSLVNLLAAVEATVGATASVELRPPRPFDVERNVLDIQRLRRLTGLRPIGLRRGLELTVARLPAMRDPVGRPETTGRPDPRVSP